MFSHFGISICKKGGGRASGGGSSVATTAVYVCFESSAVPIPVQL